MVTQTKVFPSINSVAGNDQAASPVSQLRQEFDTAQSLLRAQPSIIQRFFETQASQIAPFYIERQAQIHFSLPDRVVASRDETNHEVSYTIPQKERQQATGSLIEQLARTDPRQLFRQRLSELEFSAEPGPALAARLLRFTVANYLIKQTLPDGHVVTYITAEGDTIPSIPVDNGKGSASAITAKGDAIVEEDRTDGRGDLQVPFVPSARRFFLPQWVALDENCKLLVKSYSEAEAMLLSMKNYLNILHATLELAPYMVADKAYQQKRYGMLGQLVNQGRALATYETQQIIQRIHERAARQDLNRGLSLNLPYFDDQSLEIRSLNLDIIPAGRIMFTSAFIVRAARQEQMKVAQDTRLSFSTRKNLLSNLARLEKGFENSRV